MSVSMVMIAKNEARCINRALQSIKPYVNEMIVVDTGSTDGTPDVARDAGAKVFDFDWIDDFSAARNYSLDCATCEWRLVMDADEYLVSGGEFLKTLQNPPDNKAYTWNICIDNETDSNAVYHSTMSRLHSHQLRYEGIIHEQPAGDFFLLGNSDLVFQHDGYLSSQLENKINRNIILLNKALAEPMIKFRWYYHYQLGVELLKQRNYSSAQQQFEIVRTQYLNELSHVTETLLDFSIKYFECATQTKAFDRGYAFASAVMEKLQLFPTFFLSFGVFLLNWGQQAPDKAGVLIPIIEYALTMTIEMTKKTEKIFQGFSALQCYQDAAKNLSQLYYALGDTNKAIYYQELKNSANTLAFAEK